VPRGPAAYPDADGGVRGEVEGDDGDVDGVHVRSVRDGPCPARPAVPGPACPRM
jgi:hypothetical protein